MVGVSELTLVILLLLFSTSILCTLHFIFQVYAPVLIFLATVAIVYFVCAKLNYIWRKEK